MRRRKCSGVCHRHLGHELLTDTLELEAGVRISESDASSVLTALLTAVPALDVDLDDVGGTPHCTAQGRRRSSSTMRSRAGWATLTGCSIGWELSQRLRLLAWTSARVARRPRAMGACAPMEIDHGTMSTLAARLPGCCRQCSAAARRRPAPRSPGARGRRPPRPTCTSAGGECGEAMGAGADARVGARTAVRRRRLIEVGWTTAGSVSSWTGTKAVTAAWRLKAGWPGWQNAGGLRSSSSRWSREAQPKGREETWARAQAGAQKESLTSPLQLELAATPSTTASLLSAH